MQFNNYPPGLRVDIIAFMQFCHNLYASWPEANFMSRNQKPLRVFLMDGRERPLVLRCGCIICWRAPREHVAHLECRIALPADVTGCSAAPLA